MSGTAADPFLLPNDWILSVPDDALTAAGVEVSLPSGDVISPMSSDPTKLGATQGTTADGEPATLIHALVDGSVAPDTVYTVVLSDSAGLTPYSMFLKIVADNTPTSLHENLPGSTHTIQAVPPAG